MSRFGSLLTAFPVVLAILANCLFAEEAIFSGPQAGEVFPPLPMPAARADSELATVDLIEKAAGRPLLLVFVHEFTRPSAALTRVLMNYGETRIDDGLFPATIRLADDRSSSRKARALQADRAWSGVSPQGKEGPGTYGLNRNVGMTVLVGREGRVTASFAIVQPSVTDGTKIIAEIVKLIGGEAPTTAELEFLALSSNLAPRYRENGAAPDDPQLRKRLCGVLRAKDDKPALVAPAAEVDAYVGTDESKQRELGEASRLLLHQRYQGQKALVEDTPAGEYFRTWAKAYGKQS